MTIEIGGTLLAAAAIVVDVLSDGFSGPSNGNAFVPLSAQYQQKAFHQMMTQGKPATQEKAAASTAKKTDDKKA
jgi:hypothetical protein